MLKEQDLMQAVTAGTDLDTVRIEGGGKRKRGRKRGDGEGVRRQLADLRLISVAILFLACVFFPPCLL